MGSTVSKSMDDVRKEIFECNVPSAPVSTPQIKILDWDPRSPSSDIARTPIEVIRTPSQKSSSLGCLNVSEDKSYCSDDNEELRSIDPRSPTTEFHRTPVVITEAVLKLHNKNLDKVRGPLVVTTPAKPRKISEKVIKKMYHDLPENISIATRFLEDADVYPTENKRNSIVGLLETNMDFIETDLDVAFQCRNKFDSLSKNVSLRTEEEMELPKHETSILNEICSEEKNDINFNTDIGRDKMDDTVEIISDDLLTEKINKTLDEDQGNSFSAEELDRKLTNLIYEDKQLEASPIVNKQVGGRTPLGDRNNLQRKSIPKLKVSDKPSRPTLPLSKIPVFKEKKLRAKTNIHCENTPPRAVVPKHSQWATEDSIII